MLLICDVELFFFSSFNNAVMVTVQSSDVNRSDLLKFQGTVTPSLRYIKENFCRHGTNI